MNTSQEVYDAIKEAEFVWTTGVGKSAVVADLLARYLRNAGVPSAFLDATDYWHGGRGGVKINHLLIAVSASGTTEEIVKVVDDVLCQTIQIGKRPMLEADLHFLVDVRGLSDSALSSDPIHTSCSVYLLACGYADYAKISREVAAYNHPAGATNGTV